MGTPVKGQYPLATQDGQAVPLEIVKAANFLFAVLVANVNKPVTIPAGLVTAYVLSTVNCVLKNASAAFTALAADTNYPDAMFIPSDHLTTLQLTPGVINIWPLASGTIYITGIEQWAALSQALQAKTQ